MKTVIRALVPPTVRQAVYEARQRPWRAELERWCQDLVPDRLIQERQFQCAFGHPIQWANPTTFMEKIHWLMRYDRRPTLTQCADKVAVRDYVSKRVGPDALTQLYGIWTDPDKIDFTTLPLPCVLKVNHGSGQMLFIPSPPTLFRIEKIRAQLASWLRRSEYWVSREWAYKDIPPRILGEEFLSDASGASPTDYKFHCFGGVPLMIQVDLDRFTNHERLMRSPEWAPLPFDMTFPHSLTMPPPPPTLGAMLDMARCLSREHPYVRVDLYTLGLRIVFGEMTWYPNGGLEQIIPASWNTTIGGWLTLPTLAFCSGKS